MKLLKRVVIVLVVLAILTGIFWLGYLAKNENLNPYKDVAFDPNMTEEQEQNLRTLIEQVQAELGDPTEDFDGYMQLAQHYNNLGEVGNAIDAYLIAADIRDFDTLVWGNLGDIYERLEDYDRAELMYLKAIAAIDGFHLNHTKLIRLYRYKLDKPEEEIRKLYENAINLVMFDKSIVRDYAVWQEEIGDIEGALRFWNDLVDFDSTDTAAQENIDRLEVLVDDQL